MSVPLATMHAALGPYLDQGRLGVAVSGGSDSVAGLVLACEALGPNRLCAATVDHGLRAQAGQEAAQVAALCDKLGVPHEILTWRERPEGNLQDAAREARYALLADWARRNDLSGVIIAHTLDDQAETVLMRLARGSGVDGLGAMQAEREDGDVTWLRPLLTVNREALRAELHARGIGWIDDPSNDDTRFLRVRARQALAALAPLGIDAEGLAATATQMQHARHALEAQTAQAMAAHVTVSPSGYVQIAPALFTLPQEIRDRVVAALLMRLSSARYRPRLADMHRLIARGEGTLMGCVLAQHSGQHVLYREAQAVAQIVTPSEALWDGRWSAQGAHQSSTQIRAAGQSGLAQLSEQARNGLHPHWRETKLPENALKAMPAIWENERIIAAPLHKWPNGWQINL